MAKHVVLIMDVIGSKKYPIEERQALQELLVASTDYLNGIFHGHMEKDVDFSAGDEMQGMFYSCAGAFLYCRFLTMIVGKGVFRAGVGVGDWDILIRDRDTSAQDGAVYYKAREATRVTHTRKGHFYGLRFLLEGDGGEELTVLADHSLGTIAMRTDNQNDLALYQEIISPLVMDERLEVTSDGIRALVDTRRAFKDLKARSRKRALRGLDEGVLLSEVAKRPLFLLGSGGREALEFQMLPESSSRFVDELVRLTRKSRQGIELQLRMARVLQERNAAAFFVSYCGRLGL